MDTKCFENRKEISLRKIDPVVLSESLPWTADVLVHTGMHNSPLAVQYETWHSLDRVSDWYFLG